jgi:hypothetical protein
MKIKPKLIGSSIRTFVEFQPSWFDLATSKSPPRLMLKRVSERTESEVLRTNPHKCHSFYRFVDILTTVVEYNGEKFKTRSEPFNSSDQLDIPHEVFKLRASR